MITLRLACYTALIAALAAGCASAPTAPATSGHSPEPAAVSPQASTAVSTTTPTGDASPTAFAGAATPNGQPAPSPVDAAVRLSGNRPLAAGRYYLDNRYFTNASRLTFALPAGWTTEEYGELYKDRDEPGGVKFIT